jgi:hypothetical protein
MGGGLINMPAARIQRTAAIVTMIITAAAICWLSWRAGSPLLDHLQGETIRQAAELARLRFPGNAPKAGPEQLIGVP